MPVNELPRKPYRRMLGDILPASAYGALRSVLDPFPYRRYHNRHRCIFIHIPKNAGTSVMKMFGDNSRRRDHLTYSIYQQANRRKFESYFKFAIVRNPWDRAVSVFSYLRAGGDGEKDVYFQNLIARSQMNFRTFVMDFLTPQQLHAHPLFWPQFPFVFDFKQTLQVDCLCHFESLAEEFQVVQQRLGLSGKLPTVNRSQKSDYRNAYQDDSELIERVGELYSEDVLRFGYQFEATVR